MIAVGMSVATLILIYAVVMIGLNLIVGFGRIFSVNQALLFGVGAFAYAGTYKYFGTTELIVGWATAALAATLLSLVVAAAMLRVSGDHFIIASFGVQLAMLQVLYNWSSLSGGPAGAFGLPRPTVFGAPVTTQEAFLVLAAVTAACASVLAIVIVRSPYGRLVKAMADDEDAVTAAGFEVLPIKVGVFVLGGGFAAIAGVVYAAYIGVAQSSDFTVDVSIMLLAAVVAGGLRSIPGSVLGAVLFIGVPNALNLMNVPVSVAGPLQKLLFGLLLVAVMLFVPNGITGAVPHGRWFSRGHPRRSP